MFGLHGIEEAPSKERSRTCICHERYCHDKLNKMVFSNCTGDNTADLSTLQLLGQENSTPHARFHPGWKA